ELLTCPTEVRRVRNRGSAGVELGDKGITRSGFHRLNGVSYREIGRAGGPSDVGAARAVNRNRAALVLQPSPQIRGVDERRASGTQLGDKCVSEVSDCASIRRLHREVRRESRADEIGASTAVDRNPEGFVLRASPQVRRVQKGRAAWVELGA